MNKSVFCLDSVVRGQPVRRASRRSAVARRSPASNLIPQEDDIPTFGRLQQSMITPLSPHPPHPAPLPPRTCIYTFANTDLFYSHLPKQIRAEGVGVRAPTVRAVPSLRPPCGIVTKNNQSGGKSAYSPGARFNGARVCESRARKEKKTFTVGYFGIKSHFSLRLNAWVPPASSVLAIPPLHPRSRRGTCKHIS